jgi:hypothetical protein
MDLKLDPADISLDGLKAVLHDYYRSATARAHRAGVSQRPLAGR